jgi:hypothetical protein
VGPPRSRRAGGAAELLRAPAAPELDERLAPPQAREGAENQEPPQAESIGGLASSNEDAADRPPFRVSFEGSGMAADQSAPMIEKDVQYDRDSGAALFPPEAALAYPDGGGIVSSDEGTISFWVRRDSDPSDEKGRALIELLSGAWENRMEIGMGPNYLRFLLTNSDGVENNAGAAIRFGEGEWHHVAITWGEALMSLYVDGVPETTTTYPGSLALPPSTPLYVGSSRKGVDPNATAPIAMRQLQILQHKIKTEEVGNLMVTTAPPP